MSKTTFGQRSSVVELVSELQVRLRVGQSLAAGMKTLLQSCRFEWKNSAFSRFTIPDSFQATFWSLIQTDSVCEHFCKCCFTCWRLSSYLIRANKWWGRNRCSLDSMLMETLKTDHINSLMMRVKIRTGLLCVLSPVPSKASVFYSSTS